MKRIGFYYARTLQDVLDKNFAGYGSNLQVFIDESNVEMDQFFVATRYIHSQAPQVSVTQIDGEQAFREEVADMGRRWAPDGLLAPRIVTSLPSVNRSTERS